MDRTASLPEAGAPIGVGPAADRAAIGRSANGPDLARIHRAGLTDPIRIRALLGQARERSVVFESGLGRNLDRERAWLDSLEAGSIWLRIRNFDLDRREEVALTFSFEGSTYLMHGALLEVDPVGGRIRVDGPRVLYRVERRERERRRPDEGGGVPTRATLRGRRVEIDHASVIDYSDDGVALVVPASEAPSLASDVEVRFLDGPDAQVVRAGRVRRSQPDRQAGWQRVGLSITAAPPGPLLPVERRDSVLPRYGRAAWRDRWKMLSGGARIAVRQGLERLGAVPSPMNLDVVRFENSRGEEIVGLCDSWQQEPGTPVVVIPPAWAKTKETLLPLARTVVTTFQRAGLPIAVLRLDGVRRRGESFNDEECRVPGRECHHMTFSQGVADISATLDYLERSPRFRASKVVLVTFSGASIEARRVLASESSDRVCGWVSVVGAADLKSGLRTVSGGQDYIGGCERGVRFGIQRVLGIETDADLVCRDALDNDLAHLEDARRQMARIEAPITWIQGRYDAWIDPARVREILSCGDSSRRRLVEVPTGHQLRTSREALETFQLIASEIGRFLTDLPVEPSLPDLASLELRRQAERKRLPRTGVDLRRFWSEYLLGRDGHLGMDLLTATTPYRELMTAQVEAMDLREGDVVADLGSGTGSIPRFLGSEPDVEARVEVHELDCLRHALESARQRLSDGVGAPRVQYMTCDLSLGRVARYVPVKDGTYDSVVASLLLNYVDDPARLLGEVGRILKPGGRLVVSVLRKDTDISRIYSDAASEIRAGVAREGFEGLAGDEIEGSIRSFLNEAARLIDLEEQGLFHFWEPDELVSLVRAAGFESVQTRPCFGTPPQAIVLSGVARQAGTRRR